MKIVLHRWGNSHAIRIPKIIIDTLKLKVGDILEMLDVDGTLQIKKVDEPNFLEQFYFNFYGKSVDELSFTKSKNKKLNDIWGGEFGLDW